MLSLSRNNHQAVNITTPDGRTIIVRVFQIHEGRCKVGIEAPPDVKILREEVPDRELAPDGFVWLNDKPIHPDLLHDLRNDDYRYRCWGDGDDGGESDE